MGVRHHIPDTNSINSQKERLKEISIQWKLANTEGETFSFSDTNLNMKKLGLQPTLLDQYDRRLYPLMLQFQNEILNENNCIIRTNDTRYNPITKNTDFIDHCITNCPDKISNHIIHNTGDSDHYIGQFSISTTTKPNTPRYILSRKLDIVNWDQLKYDISVDQRLADAADLLDPSEICSIIQETVNRNVDLQAPVRKIQVSNKNPPFIKTETRKLATERDVALDFAKNNDTPENWR